MIGPAVTARVEESHEFSALPVDLADITPLRLVTEHACKSQVVLVRRAAMLLANNVIDRTAVKSVFLGYQAILADSVGSRYHQALQLCADVGEGHIPLLVVEVLASAGLREAHQMLDLEILV
jgi:hypothetical protein